MAQQAVRLPPIQDAYIPFAGGLDLVTPPIEVKEGRLRESKNFEIDINGGYHGIDGYERYDGQASPSDAGYTILDVSITGAFSVGNVVTGATSGATGTIIATGTDSNSQDYIAMTKVTGTFSDGENLEVASVVQGTAAAAPSNNAAETALLHAQYLNLAADEYRTDITVVPGSGSVLGVIMLDDVTYAFRNNAGGTAADLYKSSTSGWTAVSLGYELAFTSGGTTEIMEGDTITGHTSGATAVITRVMLESGSWAGGDAAGKFIFASQTGTFAAENIDVGASLDLATIAGDSTPITLLPDGRYEFDIENFGGTTGTKRIYGCDGVNRGFEFDGTVFCPIDTGMSTDTPTHVKAHKKQLFFSFAGSSQNSGIGTPYEFTLLTGASELATGDTITAYQILPGSTGNATLAIYNENRIHILYGNDVSDFNMVQFREEIGAHAYTPQDVGYSVFLGDQGISNLNAVQAYGNFKADSISTLVQPFVTARRTAAVESMICRDKNQYRIYFSDTYALYITVYNRKLLGIMPVVLGMTPNCGYSLETSNGSEQMMIGATDGYVYQMDKGTSFDGDDISRYLVLHFYHSKTPEIAKGYKGCMLEVDGDRYAQYDFSYELGYNDSKIMQPDSETETLDLSTSRWDSFTWEAFFWDGASITPSNLSLGGSAENISLIIRSSSDYFGALTFSGAMITYTMRRRLRRR